MANDWDQSYNTDSITEEQRRTEQLAIWAETRRTQVDRLERRYGRVDLPHISEQLIRANFPHHVDSEPYNGVLAPWHANRAVWVCHTCGSYGFKQGEIRELFKCYCCHTRNVTVCRAGELSMLIRSAGERIGINMQNVYATRQERLRTERRTRREARDRAYIEGN